MSISTNNSIASCTLSHSKIGIWNSWHSELDLPSTSKKHKPFEYKSSNHQRSKQLPQKARYLNSKGIDLSYYLPDLPPSSSNRKQIDISYFLPKARENALSIPKLTLVSHPLVRSKCCDKTNLAVPKKNTPERNLLKEALKIGILIQSLFSHICRCLDINSNLKGKTIQTDEKKSIDTHKNAQLLEQSEQRVKEPARFGIASYFPGFTSLKSLISYRQFPLLNSAVPIANGMIDESASHMEKWRSVDESKNIQMLPTAHSAQTHYWRKKLIQAAEHNIVISGNYCGQHAFDEILTLIREKLERNDQLKVVIISSPRFVKDSLQNNIENQTLITELKQRFPSQFSVVYSPDVWLIDDDAECKRTTNHIKYFGIDWGRYYILGGSAIKDNFTMSGTDNILEILSKKEKAQLALFNKLLSDLKEARNNPSTDSTTLRKINQMCIDAGESLEHILRNSARFATELTPYLERLTSVLELMRQEDSQEALLSSYNPLNLNSDITTSEHVYDDGIVGLIVPGNFRDMDFIFSDPNDGYSSGRQLFIEMTRMAYRWEALNAAYDNNNEISSFTPSEASNLPIFTQKAAQDPKSTDSVTHRIMKEPMPECSKLHTQKIKGFKDTKTGSLQMIYQGPEQPSGTNEFSSKILELIRNAKKRIVIDHMYFCPTDELIDALKEAIENRGVQVELITCAATENCPNSQHTFGPYNKWNWVKLANQLEPKHRQNFKVFLFDQKKKGLHKKVIVFDEETVLAGSSNLGYKSLVSSSDYEVNFIAKSRSFALKTLKVCEQDKKLSQEVAHITEITPTENLKASIYSAFTPLIN